MTSQTVSRINFPVWLRWSMFGVCASLLIAYGISLMAARNDYNMAQKPLYVATSESPLMLMVMSRDERLFTKAYSDYSDLDNDGYLDTTYTDSFDYSGYFDPKLCYTYSSGRFKAAAVAGGTNGHSCSGQWSGNFLNWVTMSRLDILRYVLYGGKRVTDATDRTVLERAHIPNDLHAWVKVYSGTDIGSFTPLTGTQSFCNSSHANTDSNAAPVFRQAAGNYSEWAATALNQCRTNYNTDTPSSAASYTVHVEVCDPNADANLREEFCSPYNSGSVMHYKPTGLLQSYGESGRLRFGLISGSYGAPRSGGVLRRNIGRFSGNGAGCAAGNEVNLSTGQFCNQTDGAEGIVNTIDRFRLTQWNGWTSDGKWGDCNDWGILNRQGQGRSRSLNNPGTGSDNCSAWGNPLAEMYAEALRYVGGETSATSDFTTGTDLAGMPAPAWRDPYRSKARGGNSYCANCNILVMSSGLPSFDSDEIPSIPVVGNNAAVNTATNAVGAHEGISGSYLVGRVTATPKGASINTHEDICKATNLTGLSSVRGICPDIPSLEGSHLIAGMAYRAKTQDMRPALTPVGREINVTTYGVALADNLPKFDIRVGSNTISLAPLCQANASGTAAIGDSGWRTCHLGSVGVGPKTAMVSPNHVYGRDLVYAPGGGLVAGSFSLVWEDSLWGNDHDNDVVSMLSFCVGTQCGSLSTSVPGNICWRSDSAACGGTVGANEVLVRIETLSAYAGNGMLSGYAITGSTNDGVHRLARRPGNNDGSILTGQADPPDSWDAPKVMKFSAGSGSAGLLESPLWYAAKYGGFNDANGNDLPDAGEWDTRQAGQPDNYFFARDPSTLRAELARIFETAANARARTGGGASGPRIGTASFTIEAGFDVPDDSADWTGYLRALQLAPDGGVGAELWSAATPLPGGRDIVAVVEPTTLHANGTVDDAVQAVDFEAANLGGNNAAQLAALGVPTPVPPWLGTTPSASTLVSYLRGSPVAGYRERSSRLGSIMNSQPQVGLPSHDFGYARWRFGGGPAWKSALGAGYQAYLGTKAGRTPMVYVGANDGMLHAFNAEDGGEEFAFIPATSRAHLYELANPDYDHRYFVDGQITVADASFGNTGAGDWRTVLVGTTGAGGAAIPSGSPTGTSMGHGSVFALDVSSPGGFSASDVLWELSTEHEEHLGFALGRPVVVAVAGTGGPRWVALFGNGPNSTSGLPVLFVVDIETGERLAMLRPSGGGYNIANGLINIAAAAVANSDGLVDTVYGGDLQGNLWKFDLSSSDPDSWSIAFGGTPLFASGQPITGGLEITRGPGAGVSVLFGTGRYFADVDSGTLTVQSFYSVWDNGSVISGGRSALVEQTLGNGPVVDGNQTRTVTSNPVNYSSHRGWFIDLRVASSAGERFIGQPTLIDGRVVFPTYEPTPGAVCSAGYGRNWTYVLDILTGRPRLDGTGLCTDCGAFSPQPMPGDAGQAPKIQADVLIPNLQPPSCDPADAACQQLLLQYDPSIGLVEGWPIDIDTGRRSWRQWR